MRLAANHPGVPGARRARSPTSTTGRWMAQPAADAPPAAPRELAQHRMGQYQQPPAATGPVYAPISRGLDQFRQMIAQAEKASGSEMHRWAYREFARTGIMFFKHLWDPRAHEDFVNYVRSASLTTQRVAPMFQRYLIVTSQEGYADKYVRFVRYMESDPSVVETIQNPLDVFGEALREILCQYMVLGPGGSTGGVPFSVYLCLSYLNYERAASMVKDRYTAYNGRNNVITAAMIGKKSEPWWNHGLTDEVNTGLSIEGDDHYNRLVASAAGVNQLYGTSMIGASLHSLQGLSAMRGGASVHGAGSTVGSIVHRSASQVSSVAPSRAAGPRARPAPQRESLSLEWGPVSLTGRCHRCGLMGHSRATCQGAQHPLYRETDPLYLAKMFSLGRVPLPS